VTCDLTDLADPLAGTFIVLDGPDGAGKSTQLELLAERLTAAGLDVTCVRDPGGTAVGDRIRHILLDRDHESMSVACEMLLYMASRAQLAAEHIRPALDAGRCVLCDRFISSTVAYQGTGGADVETILRVGHAAVGQTWPDLTVILDLEAEAGLDRLNRLNRSPDRIEAKSLDFHRRVRELFLAQAADDPERFAVVDAAGDVETIHEHVCRALAEWAAGR